MLGGFLSLLSAALFALENATARRGVLGGTVVQALSISVPLGVPIFFLFVVTFGSLASILGFSTQAIVYLALAGVVHFVWGRYCNYRAVKAMGVNLVAPVQQTNLLVTLALAIWILGEHLTPLRVLGIILVVLGPAMAHERSEPKKISVAAADAPAAPDQRQVFQPNYAEGYLFALLSSTGFGVSPVLVRLALENHDLAASLSGGLISYIAAALAFVLVLLWPGQWKHVRSLDREAAKWFAISGVFVCFAQMLRYMALALAPVSVVAPIQRVTLLFRLYFSHIFNPHHEVFGGRMFAATVVSLLGALALSVSTELVQSILPLPGWARTFFNWHWP